MDMSVLTAFDTPTDHQRGFNVRDVTFDIVNAGVVTGTLIMSTVVLDVLAGGQPTNPITLCSFDDSHIYIVVLCFALATVAHHPAEMPNVVCVASI